MDGVEVSLRDRPFMMEVRRQIVLSCILFGLETDRDFIHFIVSHKKISDGHMTLRVLTYAVALKNIESKNGSHIVAYVISGHGHCKLNMQTYITYICSRHHGRTYRTRQTIHITDNGEVTNIATLPTYDLNPLAIII
jgi:hypothetical protein